MDKQKNNKRISAIVPAYNEEGRIKKVLEVLATYPDFREIIVVDDGSTDKTEEESKQFDLIYIKNETNRGKGYSMDRAVSLAKSDIVFFCDADVTGLTHEIIDNIVTPVVKGEVDMFIGMRNRKWYVFHQVMSFVPLLGGERALTKELWQKLPDYYKYNFRIETGLNFYSTHFGKGFKYEIFKGLSQTIKEKKYGIWKGLRARFGMIYDVLFSQARLHIVDMRTVLKNKKQDK